MSIAPPPELSVAQSAIWFDQQLFADKPIYNTGQALTITGPLRIQLFESALRETLEESPGLRLPPRSGPARLDLSLLDLRQMPDPPASAQQWMQAEMRIPIALDDPALYRFAMLRIGEERWIWFQKYHHIIIDATGRRLLSARTAERYRALREGNEVLAAAVAAPEHIVALERRYGMSDAHEDDRAYWVSQFSERPDPLLEAQRRFSERGRSGCHSRIHFKLRREHFARLEASARSAGSSAFRALIALSYSAFASLYNRRDFVMGLELSNRSTPETRSMVGLLARPLPQRMNFDPALPLREVLRRLDEARQRDYPHRRFPLQELVAALDITRLGRYGLFDVIINYIPASYDFAFESEPVQLTNLSYGFPAPWMITVADSGAALDLDVSIDTDPGLVSADTAASLAACIENLLIHGMQDLDCPLERLPVIPPAERTRLLDLGRGRVAPLPAGATLASLCGSQAERTPEAIALRCGSRQMSFRQLHQAALGLAHRLAARGVRPGVVVGVALPRTTSLIIAILAIHKAGGAYLALDPSYPIERLRFMVADSSVPIILTDARCEAMFSDSSAQRLIYDEGSEWPGEEASILPAQPGDPAYVLYTSGSSGQPKAVAVEHRNVVNLISWGRSVISDAELSGLLFATSLNFDLSAFEIFVPLAFGGCVVMLDNLLELSGSEHRDKVRLINTSPSLLDALLRTGDLPAGVTTIILAGEKLPRRLADSIFAISKDVRLLNCYGPTETTVYSSCARVEPGVQQEPSIGHAIWNTGLYVLNAAGSLLPWGAEGELFIGGAGVSRGYLGRPELTADRFIANPFGEGRLYRTGDRVRWNSAGELDFLGRADQQIKIHGLRVEPGEIEAALLALPGVAAAAVGLSQDPSGACRLTAHLVSLDGKPMDEGIMRTALAATLPVFMLPSSFVWLRSMPLTNSGKIDRRALPPAPRQGDAAGPARVADSDLERAVARIWEEVLQRPSPGIDEDFFDLGGDSLALLNLFAAIEARFGRRLRIDVLIGGLTVAKISHALAEDESLQDSVSPIVTLQPRGDRPALFVVPGLDDVLHLHRLGMHMPAERPVYAFHWTQRDAALESIADLAAYFVAAMLERQPTGPFYLSGYCLGAQIAYEMARQLQQNGHRVAMLGIIDLRLLGRRFTPVSLIPAAYHLCTNLIGIWRNQLSLGDTLRRIPKSLGRLLSSPASGASGARAGARRATPVAHWLTGESHLQALRRYRPAPTTIPITLFRAAVTPLKSLPLDSALGWSDVALAGVRVHTIPGDHTLMITEPLVRHLASALTDAMNDAQPRQSTGEAVMLTLPGRAAPG